MHVVVSLWTLDRWSSASEPSDVLALYKSYLLTYLLIQLLKHAQCSLAEMHLDIQKVKVRYENNIIQLQNRPRNIAQDVLRL